MAKERFYLTEQEYINATGDKDGACKYECMECGCKFFGRYHSMYSIGDVKCPRCKDETDPIFIRQI
jgi:DNA-directed RNA polymerase subunit RPC12/RpoP